MNINVCNCGSKAVFEKKQRTAASLYDLSVKCSGCGKEKYFPLSHAQDVGYRKNRLIKMWNRENKTPSKIEDFPCEGEVTKTEEQLVTLAKSVIAKMPANSHAARHCGVNDGSIKRIRKCGPLRMDHSTVYSILSGYADKSDIPIPSPAEISEALTHATSGQMTRLRGLKLSSIYRVKNGDNGMSAKSACRLTDALKKEGLL